MRRFFYILLAAFLVCGIYYLYVHRQPAWLFARASSNATTGSTGNPAATGQNGNPLNPPTIVWTSIDRSQDGFQVDLPTGVNETQIPAYNEFGGTDQVDMLYAYPDPYISFSVAWADEPPVERVSMNSADKTLETARDGALVRTQTVLISENKANLLGFPALDFVGRHAGGGLFNARLILAGRRLYLLMAAFPSESARREEDVNHFFESFRITSKN